MSKSVVSIAIGLALGWLTLALAFALYSIVRKQWRARRYGAPVDHSLLLVEYGRRMMGVLDRQALGELLIVDLPRVFRVDRATLLLPEDHHLVALGINEGGVQDDLRLPVSHAAVRWVASTGEAQQADRGRLYELISQGRADLSWIRVWVPLMRGVDLHGLWLLGARGPGPQPRRSGAQTLLYSPEDLRCLTALARQAAVMLEATRYAERERQTTDQLRVLYRQVVNAREAERGRLSRELHDGVLQDMCAVTRDLKALEAQIQTGGAPFADLAERSGQTVHSLRAICNNLRPPLLQQDLVMALKAMVDELDARSKAPIDLGVSIGDMSLADDVAVAVYRIAQEALHNAIQHADASEIAVRLTQYPDRLRLTVTDDGQGIAGGVEVARFVAQGHLGLAGMRERAAMIGAKLDVQTAVDYGTVVILELPR